MLLDSLVRRASSIQDPEIHVAVHADLVRRGMVEQAATLPTDRIDDETRATLAFERQLATHELEAAAATLADIDRAQRPADGAIRLFQQLQSPALVLDALDGADLPPQRRMQVEFDARWSRGDVDGARRALDLAPAHLVTTPAIAVRYRQWAQASGLDAWESYLSTVGVHFERASPDQRAQLLYVFGRLEHLVDDHGSRGNLARLGPIGRLCVARAWYVPGDFERARSILQTLEGTVREADAHKLADRMILEAWEPERALAARRRRVRMSTDFDEVEFFALLHLGEHEAAFATYLTPQDRARATAVFGESASPDPRRPASHRYIVPQGGPGDEIQLSSVYRRLIAGDRQVSAACEPRLQSLLERSFPEIAFDPVERTAQRVPLGALGPNAPARSADALSGLLTASAARSAARCDAVSLGRTLALASVGCEPAEAYLRPDVELIEWARRRVPAASIGLVWRSELNDPMRTIHYVDVLDLAPLAKLDGQFVCLQHDVDEAERHELNHTFPGRIVFLDDVDLRNDFERAAAIVSVCGQVVGVGTTMTELAAAVGTPTVTMIPNAMGAWRGLGGRDHWHRSATIVSAPFPRAQRACVERALDLAVRR